MSNVLVNDASLTAIASAIRAKNGTQDTYKPGEMAAAITNIHEAVLGTKNISENGTYNASDDNLDGFSSVTVGVSSGSASGTKIVNITENGTVTEDVMAYANAEISVNVPSSGGDYVAADFADKTKPTGAVTFLQASFPANAVYFAERTGITKLYAPNLTTTGNLSNVFRGMTALQYAIFPNCVRFYNSCFFGCTNLVAIDCKGGSTGGSTVFSNCSKLKMIILRKSDGIAELNSGNSFGGTPFASGNSGGTIYIPKALYDHLGDGSSLDYKAASNWSAVDGLGTITWACIEGSQYETKYVDGTDIPSA